MSYVCSSALVHLYPHLLPLLLQTPSEQCSNSALYWSSQIIGSLAISYVCDLPTYTTRQGVFLLDSVRPRQLRHDGARFSRTIERSVRPSGLCLGVKGISPRRLYTSHMASSTPYGRA